MTRILPVVLGLLALVILASHALGIRGDQGDRPAGVRADATATISAPVPATSEAQTPVRSPAKAVAPRPAAAATTLEVSPVPARQDGSIRIAGRGFTPGELVLVQVAARQNDASDLPLKEIQADRQGAVGTTNLALPSQLTSGSYVLEAIGEASGKQARTTLSVRAKAPFIVLGSTDVNPGEKLGLVAGGFQPGERVLLTLEPRPETADQSPGPRTQPTATPASRPTETPSVSGEAPLAKLTPGPQQEPAQSVTLTTLATDQVGNTVWTEIGVDHLKRGAYTLVARGESSGQTSGRDVTLKPYHPSVELSPWYGTPGTKIELNAKGFAPGEPVHVYLGFDTREAARLVADQYGNLWGAGPVKVPYDVSAASLAVTVVGDESNAPATVEFKVGQPKPWLELTNWWGAPGAPVGFGGGGWAGGENVTVHLGSDSGPVVATGQADDYGWLRNSSVAYVPRSAASDVAFVAVGQQSHTVATATFKVVFPFGIKPSP